MSLLKPGDRYKDFELQRVIPLTEIDCLLKQGVHLPTGAPFMHIENDDTENVFCLSFRTLPNSSNGVAHILEHTVLCGSKKYPVKDPFFAMTRRSLNTFMNAFTGSDSTFYPAATQIPKDFYNLLEVYLDAVFHPNLRELSFLQEGHRLEFTEPSDPTSPLEYKGIVYNEMKGAMSSPDSRLSDAFDKALFPDLTYGFNSGGDPKNIPDLSYQELLDFHRTYYHPSRCLFYFYGNLPLEGHLDFIEKNVLCTSEKKEAIPLLPKQPRFKEPVRLEIGYPFSTEEDPLEKTMFSLGWLTCDLLDQDTLLALGVISMALLDTDASPLKMALLKSGLCKQVFAGMGDEQSEVSLIITLRGCNLEQGPEIEKLIFDTLSQVVKEGLPKHLIENAMHQVEFQRSEIDNDNMPFGLVLFMRAAHLIQHGGNPESCLFIHSLFDRLYEKVEENPRYLESLIETYFLQNPHFVRVAAVPDKTLNQKEAAEERARLEQIQNTLDDHKKAQIVAKAQELHDFQKEQEDADIDILPKLTLADVPRNATDYPLQEEKIGALTVYRHDCSTNKILYADLIFPLPYLEEHELPYLKLFSLFMPQVGCGGRSYVDNLAFMQAYTGGVGVSHSLHIQAHHSETFAPSLQIQGKALFRNRKQLFQILKEMTDPDFTDAERLEEILTKHVTGIESTLNQNALRYAISLASSSLGMASRISYACGGLEYFHSVKHILNEFTKDPSFLIAKLQELKQRMLQLKGPHLVISCDKESYKDLADHAFYGLAELNEMPYRPFKADYSLPVVEPQARLIPSPVAFTCIAMKSLPYTHPDAPALSAAAKLFDNVVLHALIREQGGAYGGGAGNNPMAGIFTFYSYRDPNIASTFNAFDQALEKIIAQDFDASDLEEAKLEIVQDLDSPISAGSRAHVTYSRLREGKTLPIRQAFRERLLNLTVDQVANAVKIHLLPAYKTGIPVVFSGKELLEKENPLLLSLGKAPLKELKI